MNNLTNQQKGSLMAFIGVMFITPDSLLIRLSNIDTWGMLFYRGAIPFLVVLVGLLLFCSANGEICRDLCGCRKAWEKCCVP